MYILNIHTGMQVHIGAGKICKYRRGSRDGGYDTSFRVKREKYAKITEVIQKRTERELNKRTHSPTLRDIAPIYKIPEENSRAHTCTTHILLYLYSWYTYHGSA